MSGYDLVFSCPKSVSLLHALTDDEQVRREISEAHEQAWQAALGYLEREACIVRRGKGGAVREHGEAFVAAAFSHRTSRAQDPHLHTHVVVANMTRTADGEWRALDGEAILKTYRLAAGYLYEAHLRNELSLRLGVEWTEPIKGMGEIRGVPEQVLRAFSTRRQSLLEHMEALGTEGFAASRVAALAAVALAAPVVSFAGGSGGPIDGHGQIGPGVPVTPAQAYAALTAPGVVMVEPGMVASGPSGTTYAEIAPGLTPRQAVGLDPIPAAEMARLEADAATNATLSGGPNVLPCPTCGGGGGWTGCERYSYTYWWQVSGVGLEDHTQYCGTDGILTSRTTTPVEDGSIGCTSTGTSQYVDNGGIGQTWEDWTDVGYYDCQGTGVTNRIEMHVGGPLTSTSYSFVGASGI